ncbi:helix-turn-helix domain-containing protein [Candidatus Nomurabacteria bacterium]|nr:helix-turn-helix domain-containing protein [Candidatus Nomurabacteria bacterium]
MNYLSLFEAAEYLKLSKSTLYKLTHKRAIQYYQPGGKIILFLKEDLDAYIMSGRVDTKNSIISNRVYNLKHEPP